MQQFSRLFSTVGDNNDFIDKCCFLSLPSSSSPSEYSYPCFLFSLVFGVVHFVFALLAMVGACIQHLLGLGRQPMGQFSVLLALCHRVLLISTFFPPPLRPSREVVLVTSLIVNNGFQWEQTDCPLHAPLQVLQCRAGTFRRACCTVCLHPYSVWEKV